MSTARFEEIADEYDDARPDYPPGLYDALDEAVAGLAGRNVVEVGAGTGIATRQLIEREAHVLAVELGAAMLAKLRDRTAVAAVQGRGEAIPVRSGWADLVCAAQAWHWVDPEQGAAEAARVLRPGGVFAAWWSSDRVPDNPWCGPQDERLARHNPAWQELRRRPESAWRSALESAGFIVPPHPVEVRWSRSLRLDRFMRWLSSKSYVHEASDRAGFLAAERAAMKECFPDGQIVEHFVTALWVARRTS